MPRCSSGSRIKGGELVSVELKPSFHGLFLLAGSNQGSLVGAEGFEPSISCSQSTRVKPGYATPRYVDCTGRSGTLPIRSSRAALTAGHSSRMIEKITLSRMVPSRRKRWRRRTPSSLAPSFLMAAESEGS